MAAEFSLLQVTNQTFAEQQLVVYGAGAAGAGGKQKIATAMERTGLSREKTSARGWLIKTVWRQMTCQACLTTSKPMFAPPLSQYAWVHGAENFVFWKCLSRSN